VITFSSTSSQRELVPGRFMYDAAHWQSRFLERSSNFNGGGLSRFAGRHESPPFGSGPDPALPYTRYLRQLPPRMEFKTPDSDSLPPNRMSGFYPTTADIEYMDMDNRIIEDIGLDPDQPNEVSTLDTLYEATGGPLERDETRHYPLMTYYHGPSVPQGFIFTGFDIWTYKRTQCQALVDFVMQRMWGLSRAGAAYAASGEGAGARPSTGARRPGLGRPDRMRPWRPPAAPRRAAVPPGDRE
jgi:hypothetical protein